MNIATTGSLEVLREAVDPTVDGVDVVLVPGTKTTPPEEWSFADEEWLASLPAAGKGVRLLRYNYKIPFSATKGSWESVLMLGYNFIKCLSDEQLESTSDVISNTPIIIVSHSLGGILVKQALCVANQQLPRYESIVNAIAGIIFLSTPHRCGDKTSTFIRFRDVYEATTSKGLKIPQSIIEQEGAILHDLADRFEGIALRTPMLSVFELKETKNNSTPLRPKYQQLVDRETCSTHAPMEAVIGLNVNHYDTCLFTKSAGGEGLHDFNDFIDETFRGAIRLVALRQQDQEYQYATASSYSPTLSELPLKGKSMYAFLGDALLTLLVEYLEVTEYPSNRATDGTSRGDFEVIQPLSPKPQKQSRRPLHIPCFFLNIHAVNPDFYGREDILDLLVNELLPSRNRVTASGTGLRQFTLCGFGGIGKTEIAREFCRRHKAAFDAVFWVTADEVAKLDYDYQQMSLILGLEDPSECKSQVVSREIMKGWLSSPRKHVSEPGDSDQPGESGPEATWLLVFDNADDPMMLADYWPHGSGSILITSRDPLSKTIFTRKPSGIDLGPLTPEDGLSLFNYLISSIEEEGGDKAKEISDALGGVPLAISQMAGIIRRQDLTLSEFFELYTNYEEHASLYGTKFDTSLVAYPHSLSTVFAFDKLKGQSRQLLELISFLDPDVIEEDLLMSAYVKLASDGTRFKKANFIDARTDLLQSSLIQRDKQKRCISVHRIVQDTMLATMDDAQKRTIFERVVHILWADWPSAMPVPSKEPELPKPKSAGNRQHVGRWPICAAIYPHVLSVHQLWVNIPDHSEAVRLHFARLLSEAAWYQKERGWTQGFDGFFDTALSICESSTHPDRDSVLADIHFCLGAIAMDASDFNSSRTHKEKSLDLVYNICQQLGVADERLYLAFAERGISRIQDKRYSEGETDLKDALAIRKALPNYIPRAGEATLSWALLHQEKLEECNNLLVESLELREAALGIDDSELVKTGLILSALGSLRAAQKRWDESFEYHDRAWRHMRRTVGDRDVYTARVAYKLAEHFVRSKRPEEAMIKINQALDTWSVDPTSHKNEIARATFFKGRLFEETGKVQKASIALRVAGRLRKEITGKPQDPKTLTIADFDELVAFWTR